MSGQFYDNADRRVYRFAALTLSAAAVVGRVIGPLGKQGRVRGMEYIVTTATTVAVTTVTAGNNGAVLPAALTIPVSAVDLGGAMSAAQIKAAGAEVVVGVNDVELAADTVVEITSDGGATAGAAGITVAIDWF